MTEQEKILSRIREALRVSAPFPGHDAARLPSTPGPAHSPREWLPPVGETFEQKLALFQKNATDLMADFQMFDSQEAALGWLVALCKNERWQKLGTHSGVLT